MKKIISAIIMFCIIGMLTSCNNYYKAALGTKPVAAGSLEELKSRNKYFILREGNNAFTMTALSFSPDRKTLQCRLDSLPQEHQLHLTSGIDGKMRYIKENEEVLNEVHVYTMSQGNAAAGPYSLNLDQVQKVEIIEQDKARTRKSNTKGTIIGIGASLLAVGAILFAAVASSFSSWGH